MSGHSKWSTIKRKKGVKDQARGQVFSKMSKLITIAVKEGGGLGDPENNVRLRLAIERAKSVNMPKENIKRAIEKGRGGESGALNNIIYEGFGPQGVSLIIHAMTDNQNRTHAQVKTILEKGGGKMGGGNSVAYLFEKCGVVAFKKRKVDEAKIFEFADKITALDIDEDEENSIVYIPFEKLGHVDEHLPSGIDKEAIEIDLFYKPKTTVSVSSEQEKKIIKLVDTLEESEDVDKVYGNYEVGG